jgi:selenide, water dikinase
MGGEVVLALNICGFPCGLPPEMITEILRGGAEKVREAGAVIAGGHTIDDKEPKYGLSVLGRINPNHILTKAGAQPGDMLALTKPLGVGIITTAAKGEVADPLHVAAAIESMKKLNQTASRLIQQAGVHACTDITGFALLGHSCEMAEKSGVQLQFFLSQIPFLDGAKDYAGQWLFPGGSTRNQQFYKHTIEFDPNVSEEMQQLLFTPETSGGLLIAFPRNKADHLKALFAEAHHRFCIVGEVHEGKGLLVTE